VALTQFSSSSFTTGLTPSELRGDFTDGFLLALGLEGARGCGLASPWCRDELVVLLTCTACLVL
jgi:hypothetical protein